MYDRSEQLSYSAIAVSAIVSKASLLPPFSEETLFLQVCRTELSKESLCLCEHSSRSIFTFSSTTSLFLEDADDTKFDTGPISLFEM